MVVLPSNHVSVLREEVIEWLAPQPGQTLVDGTLGGGGHTSLLAAQVGPAGKVICLDCDPHAVERAAHADSSLPVLPIHANFRHVHGVLRELGVEAVDGILVDLGLSSDQLADRERGFSFSSDGELDLRFDPSQGEPAWRLLTRLSEKTLADLIYQYGEERYSRRIARRIVETRKSDPIRTASELAQLVRRCVPKARNQRIDGATRTFQALRIAVNDELVAALSEFLKVVPPCLRPGGRLAVISFHSLEDRLVKQAFRDDNRYMILTKKPIRPNQAEIDNNPRSRSARLRVAARSTSESS